MKHLERAAGIWHATCWQIVDCGLQRWYFDAEERSRTVREINISFELWNTSTTSGQPKTVESRYNLSFWPNAKLRKHLEGWLGRPLEPEEKRHFPWRTLIGAPASLRLAKLDSGYYTIAEIRRGPYIKPPTRTPTLLLLQEFDPDAWARLSGRLRDRILRSPTFEALHGQPVEQTREASASERLGDEVPW